MKNGTIEFKTLRDVESGLHLSNHVSRSGEFVLVGGMTPHDPDRGTLTTGFVSLPEDAKRALAYGIYFVDSQLERVKAQTWQVLSNLSEALARCGSSLDRLVHMRVFLRDIRDEAAVIDVLQRVLGDVPSGEILQAWNPGGPIEMDVQIDGIAVVDASRKKNISIDAMKPFTAPFAVATRGGDLLFTSCLPGINLGSDTLVTRLREVPSAEREMAKKAVGPLTPRVESYVAQQLTIWSHFHQILADQNIPRTNLLWNFAWVSRSMREMADGYTNRMLYETTGSKHCFTSFPVSSLRFPDALIEGRIVAVYPNAKQPKTIKTGDHGMSGAYVGAAEGGGLIFTSGEVPVQTEKGYPIRSAADLDTDSRRLNFGRWHSDTPILAQADFVLTKLKKTLEAHGVTFADVAHQTIYLTNPADYPAVERIAAMHFGVTLPPTTVVPIHRPSNSPEALLEYEVTLSSPAK